MSEKQPRPNTKYGSGGERTGGIRGSILQGIHDSRAGCGTILTLEYRVGRSNGKQMPETGTLRLQGL